MPINTFSIFSYFINRDYGKYVEAQIQRTKGKLLTKIEIEKCGGKLVNITPITY